MVNLLIKNVRVMDGNSPWNNKKIDLLIKGGKIDRMAKKITSKYRTIEEPNLHVSIGWYDLRANFRDPGFEYKEDVFSGLDAAAKGGYTRVCVSPDTKPVIADKSGVQYVMHKANGHPCSLRVMGAISNALKGEELAEMYDMAQNGAVLFGDGDGYIQSGGLMMKALLYAKSFGAGLVTTPMDKSIAGIGEIHEGKQSVVMGVKGIPAVAETIALHRDIHLLKYTEGRLHVASITTEEGVAMIRKAKKQNLDITAGVSILHLIKTDEALQDYDVNYKVWPPLRSEKDRRALVKGVMDGTIDVITSDHAPQDVEEKKVEFGRASFGVITLEAVFGLYGKYLQDDIPLPTFVKCVTQGAYQVSKEEMNVLKEGELANLTFFQPGKEWVFYKKELKSKSENTPFLDEVMIGKIVGVVNNNKTTL